jgi:trans-aconitate methyltransferase
VNGAQGPSGTSANIDWDPVEYDRRFAFVTQLGGGVVELLGPLAGASVLDIGSGTGHLTESLRVAGAGDVVGIDASPAMVAAARRDHPGITFVVGDAQHMTLQSLGRVEPFGAAFSNAALHWMPRGDLVAAAVRGMLHPGGRFAAELGGVGNVARIDSALAGALTELGLSPDLLVRNTFPTPAQQARWLEDAGFRVRQLRWYERPTPLQSSLTAADWTRHFRAKVWAAVPPALAADLAASVDARAQDAGLREGGWHIDYCRLQFLAEAL